MKLTVTTTINKSIKTVWDSFTLPQHIINWHFASKTWCSPFAEIDLREGAKFKIRMQAKNLPFEYDFNGSGQCFDFEGTYTLVMEHKQIDYVLADDRTISVLFKEENGQTTVTEIFDPENENPTEMQQQGWQMILDNFKSYAESL